MFSFGVVELEFFKIVGQVVIGGASWIVTNINGLKN